MSGFNLLLKNTGLEPKAKILQLPIVRRRRAPANLLSETVMPKRIPKEDIVGNLFQQEIQQHCEQFDYIQGQRPCPVCGGVVNYTWSRREGFKEFECDTNDCLPWPMGGAKRRRANGEPKIIAERYREK